MKRSIIIVIVSSLVALGLLAGLAFGHGDVKRHESFGFAGVTRVVLNDTQGKIRITAGGTGAVKVDRTSTTLFAHATDTARLDGNVLHLDSHCNHTLCTVDYRLTVPRGVRLKIAGKNIDVAVDGSPGSVGVAATGEAKIVLRLARAAAVVDAHTHGGEIAITVPRGRYAVSAHAWGGVATTKGVTVSPSAKHAINASSGSGDVTIAGR